MTGFFNPQGFLTAMRQEVTRSHKGWALDSVICQNLVTRFAKEDIHDSPPEGVYIHGLYKFCKDSDWQIAAVISILMMGSLMRFFSNLSWECLTGT